MKQYAVIGNPIAHSLSPYLHNYVFRKFNINAEYSAINCPEQNLPNIIEQLRNRQMTGINVTIPLKQAIIPYLDIIDKHAKAIGAVNCVVMENEKLVGYNTDWFGFHKALGNAGFQINGDSAIIVGAGGRARSVAYALVKQNIGKIIIVNRTTVHAEELMRNILVFHPNINIEIGNWNDFKDELRNAVIINCTSVGMTPKIEACPIPSKYMNSLQTIIDTIYTPLPTKLCRVGKARGAKVLTGLPMLIYQGVASLDIWFEKPISVKINVAELHKYLENIIKKIEIKNDAKN